MMVLCCSASVRLVHDSMLPGAPAIRIRILNLGPRFASQGRFVKWELGPFLPLFPNVACNMGFSILCVCIMGCLQMSWLCFSQTDACNMGVHVLFVVGPVPPGDT